MKTNELARAAAAEQVARPGKLMGPGQQRALARRIVRRSKLAVMFKDTQAPKPTRQTLRREMHQMLTAGQPRRSHTWVGPPDPPANPYGKHIVRKWSVAGLEVQLHATKGFRIYRQH